MELVTSTIPDQVLRVGVLGTLNILEWLKDNKKTKILFSSSSETYAGSLALMGEEFPIPTPEDIPLVIDDVANPRWSYAAGKMVSEVALNCYAKAHGMNNFSIIRYHNVYGPRMGFKHVIPQMLERVANKEAPFKIYGADESRAFCYVDDAVKATQLVMESEQANGQIVHIGKNEEITINELAEQLLKISGHNVETAVQPSFEGSVKRRCPDVSMLAELGFEASVTLEEGLTNCFEWYQDKFK
jgi:nucleoside-diphosphate-sugar epimerase